MNTSPSLSLNSQISQHNKILSSILVVNEHKQGMYDITDLEIVDLLTITKTVIVDRLSNEMYDEWKDDKKNKYVFLISSIQKEVIYAIRQYFSDNVDNTVKGIVFNRIITLFIDSMFDVFRSAGIDQMSQVACDLIDAHINTVFTQQSSTFKQAQSSTVELNKQVTARIKRLTSHKPLTKKQRIAAIAMSAVKIQQ